jgi:hypothetical protein
VRPLAASAAIGVGLLVTLAATLAPLPAPTAAAGASVSVRLAAPVQTVVLVLLGLSAILLMLAWRRARRPAEEGMLPFQASERRSPWAAVLSLVPLLALLAAVWYLVHHRVTGEETHPIERAITAIAGLLDLLARARKPPTSVPLFDAAIAALVLLAALAIFLVLFLLVVGGRLESWWGGRSTAGVPAAAVPARRRPGDPRAERDPRLAVIRAWEGFEHALDAARAPRAPWQTPAEFMRAVLARAPVPASPVRRLTALFEQARFSDRPLTPAAGTAACDCLDAITAALEDDPR